MTTVEHPVEPPVAVPRRISVAGDGDRVIFLRAPARHAPAQLWVYDVASATERLVADPHQRPGVTGYATDATARLAVFTLAGQIYRADLLAGGLAPVRTAAAATDPRLDPTGQWVGYRAGDNLRVTGPGGDALLAGEPDPAYGGQPHISWGDAGWWWSPDGRSVLATRTDHRPLLPQVSLHLLDLDGGWVDVHWDRETYPHLASVHWCDHGSPVVAVLRRSQQHGLVLAVDPRTGETQVHAELADPRWVEPIAGTPRHLPDGRVLIGGELAHDGYDARCLFADGALLTPPSLYVRRVVGRLPGSPEILVEAAAGEPSEQHLYRVATSVTASGIDARPITTTPGWHRAEVGGDTLALGSESLEHSGTHWTVWRGGRQVGELNRRARTSAAPRPVLQRVTDRRLPSGVLYPAGHLPGRRLPVLVDLSGGLRQRVRAARQAWLARQQWADAGFAVVTIDHRGTPGVAPSFEKVVHRRLADLALSDLVDGLAALAGKHPDLDLARVALRGRHVGGWLAALAALRRPDVFRCAAAREPVVDWADGDPALAERFLGATEAHEVYQRHCLVTVAAEVCEAAPVLLAPTIRSAAAAQRLAAAMAAAGLPHTLLPATDDEQQPVAEELRFLRDHTDVPLN